MKLVQNNSCLKSASETTRQFPLFLKMGVNRLGSRLVLNLKSFKGIRHHEIDL